MKKEVMILSKKQRNISVAVFAVIIALLLFGIIISGRSPNEAEPIKEVMKDAVLHENGKIHLFGSFNVNPGLISAYSVSCILIVFAVAAGVYIFFGTLFELFGFQALTTAGHSISLPAPLADINGAIAMGFLSYGVILTGGLIHNGIKGMLGALKDFSLPISMSFRLFGALLSGALVTELVYAYTLTSYVLPVIVAVLFTLLHALIQAYVLTTLVSIFYGESTEKKIKSAD